LQQVNLYTEEFRPKKDPLAFRKILGAAVGLLVLCALYSAYLIWSVIAQEQTLVRIDSANEDLQLEVDGMQARLDARAKDSRLQNDNEVLKIRLHNTQLLLATIKQGVNEEGVRQRFGDILVALAKHRIEPVWLSQVQISDGGERLSLIGHTREPDQVPVYLRAIGQESVLSGRSFNLFNIELPEQAQDIRTFKVDTQATEVPGNDIPASKKDIPASKKQGGKQQTSNLSSSNPPFISNVPVREGSTAFSTPTIAVLNLQNGGDS